ncbi:MAG: FAD-dependent oxidoreductase [Caldilineaceae bacterium]|jgi:predicted NAD/FAD-dependent oxidoreductase|nr:FAD-dependent oxidoreductase [Caldilineaceae bacterium]
MKMQTQPVDVAIVGAGLCGLMAGAVLAEHGQRVVLLDKGRSVGGRLATRRIGAGRADHGAQFFTVRSPRFGAWVERWRAADIVYQWGTGWSDGSLATTAPDGHPRYAVRGGMNALAKHLAAQGAGLGATIHTGVRVTAIEALPAQGASATGGWKLLAEDGASWTARTVVMTAPAPQSLAILAAGGVDLLAEERSALEAIQYAPCLCGLFTVHGAVRLPAPGALQQPDADISWIADNQRKGISPDATVLTAHGSPPWSATHYAAPDDAVLSRMKTNLNPWLDQDAVIVMGEVKRWRYAIPTALHAEPMLRACTPSPLYFGGDGFGAPRVEGAALSGLAIAADIAGRATSPTPCATTTIHPTDK